MKGLASLSLEGRRALVTGGGTGLGRAIALGFAEAGAELVICARRRDLLEATADLARQHGAPVTVVEADITAEADIQALTSAAGQVDILVNNAGTGVRAAWEESTLEQWRSVLEVNLLAPFRLCQTFAPKMRDRGWGRIINIASVYGSMGPKPEIYQSGWGKSEYFASKHGLHGITHFLAPFLAPHGVNVNSLSPGLFLMSDQRAKAAEPGLRLLDRLTSTEIQTKTVGAEEDFAAAAVFLASPGARYVTGQNLIVDGGWSAW